MAPKLACILLVDDDSTTNYLNRKLLEKMAVSEQIIVVQNGQEALRVLDEHCYENSSTCPSLVFLDVNMPLMDGFDFLAAYQQLPLAQRKSLIIIMLTTSVHPRDMERLEKLPVAGFLNKPLTEAKVKQVLADNFG